MKFPPWLISGDRVAIISPAGKIDRHIVDRGAGLLQQHGYVVEIGRHTHDEDGVFAGTDAARAADMQQALDDPAIKAIFFSRGGYGCLRTHQRLNWSAFLENPKWLVGLSDITVFHAYLARHQIASIHGVMAAWFSEDDHPSRGFLQMMDMVTGNVTNQVIPAHECNRTGTATGILTGGNLSVIQSLRGTPLDIEPQGRILFIEDIGEYHYHLDRMMQNLKTGGILEQLSGLIVGYFTAMKDGASPYGRTACEIIREAVDPYHYPVACGFPSGHESPCNPLLMGCEISLQVAADGAQIHAVTSET